MGLDFVQFRVSGITVRKLVLQKFSISTQTTSMSGIYTDRQTKL